MGYNTEISNKFRVLHFVSILMHQCLGLSGILRCHVSQTFAGDKYGFDKPLQLSLLSYSVLLIYTSLYAKVKKQPEAPVVNRSMSFIKIAMIQSR